MQRHRKLIFVLFVVALGAGLVVGGGLDGASWAELAKALGWAFLGANVVEHAAGRFVRQPEPKKESSDAAEVGKG